MTDREAKARALAGILAASEQAGGPGAESLASTGGGSPDDPRAVLDRVEEKLSDGAARTGASSPLEAEIAEAESAGDGDSSSAHQAALDHLLRFGEAALAKVKSGDFALSPDEGCAMEALVVADGSRPSFVLRNGLYDCKDPFVARAFIAWDKALCAGRTSNWREEEGERRSRP